MDRLPDTMLVVHKLKETAREHFAIKELNNWVQNGQAHNIVSSFALFSFPLFSSVEPSPRLNYIKTTATVSASIFSITR